MQPIFVPSLACRLQFVPSWCYHYLHTLILPHNQSISSGRGYDWWRWVVVRWGWACSWFEGMALVSSGWWDWVCSWGSLFSLILVIYSLCLWPTQLTKIITFIDWRWWCRVRLVLICWGGGWEWCRRGGSPPNRMNYDDAMIDRLGTGNNPVWYLSIRICCRYRWLCPSSWRVEGKTKNWWGDSQEQWFWRWLWYRFPGYGVRLWG